MRWDFFHRRESNRRDVRSQPCVPYVFEIDTEDLKTALDYAYENGMPRGSHRTGCVEVQNDQGVYSREDGNRIDMSTPRRAAKTNFEPWGEG